MTIIDREGARTPEAALAARVAEAAEQPVPGVGGSDPVEILAAVVAAFATGRQLVLEDGPAIPREGGAAPIPPAGPVDLGAIRRRLREGRAEGSVTLSTSGTTGKPTAVGHGWTSLLRGLRTGPKHQGKVWGLCYHPAHIAGLQVLLQAFLNDCDLVDLFGASPRRRAAVLAGAGVTHLSATPSFHRLLFADLEESGPFPAVESVAFGGERLDPVLLEQARRLFPAAALRNIYASTEGGTLLVSETDVFTVPDSLRDALRVEEGRLLVGRRLLGRFDRDAPGWYDTGDRVEVLGTAPLRFRFAGRKDENVSVGGYNVNLAEVEDRLRAHPAVREARVRARKNAVLGNVLVAEAVVGGAAVPESALRAYLEKDFPPHAVPRKISLVPELALSRTGKLQR